MVYSDNALRSGDRDTLDRDRMAKALAEILGSETTETPLVVGVFGGWGTGKTSLMRRLEGQVTEDGRSPAALSLWFDAWKFARQEQSLWRALILTLIESLRRRVDDLVDDEARAELARDELDRLRDSLYRSVTLQVREGHSLNWGNAVPLAADLALRYVTGGLSDEIASIDQRQEALKQGPFARFVNMLKGDDAREAIKLIEAQERERYIAEVTSMEQFRESFQNLLQQFGIGLPAAGRQRRLFVFVDDLDRCLPDDAVAALEAIKLFLDLPGCVFVLGMDRSVVEPGIRARYKPFLEQRPDAFDPAAYLDKIIQIPFTLPPLGEQQLTLYLDDLARPERDPDRIVEQTRDLVELVVPDNPRSLKRIFNVLRVIVALDGDRWEDKRRLRRYLAKMVLLQMTFPRVYEAVVRNEIDLVTLEERIKSGTGAADSDDRFGDVKLADLLHAEPTFAELKAEHPEELERLITLSGVVEGPSSEADRR